MVVPPVTMGSPGGSVRHVKGVSYDSLSSAIVAQRADIVGCSSLLKDRVCTVGVR